MSDMPVVLAEVKMPDIIADDIIADDIITETRDGRGTQRIELRHMPVKVLSLTIDGLDIPAYDITKNAGWIPVARSRELLLRGYIFTRRPRNVVIRYRVEGLKASAETESARKLAELKSVAVDALKDLHAAIEAGNRNPDVMNAYARLRIALGVAMPRWYSGGIPTEETENV